MIRVLINSNCAALIKGCLFPVGLIHIKDKVYMELFRLYLPLIRVFIVPPEKQLVYHLFFLYLHPLLLILLFCSTYFWFIII